MIGKKVVDQEIKTQISKYTKVIKKKPKAKPSVKFTTKRDIERPSRDVSSFGQVSPQIDEVPPIMS